MRIKSVIAVKLVFNFVLISFFPVYGQVKKDAVADMENERNIAYANQLENYLRLFLVEQYDERASKFWDRDYSSIDAFKRSVESNREKWESEVIKPPVLRKTAPVSRREYIIEDIKGEWLELPLGPVTAQAFLAFPRGSLKIIRYHLLLSSMELEVPPKLRSEKGTTTLMQKSCLKQVLPYWFPLNLRSVELRNRIERLCRLADISLPGIELARVQHLLDVVLTDPRIDPERVGMWGLSLGGMATMFWMPLEPRIKAGIVSGWFNHRRNKMVIPDDRYSCFLETKEEHAFFTAWLTEFTDHDVVSLICPRPLLIQHGKKDGIAYWPQVQEEFDIAKTHYEKLKIGDRIQIDIHEGGHEAIIETGVKFMTRWLGPGSDAR